VLPNRKRRMVGPWIFFDEMGPATYQPGEQLAVRPHPHIGLATVTYLFEGEIFHRDSLGTAQAITPGAVNLMVTGNGMVHSERERSEQVAIERRLHGLQLWLALPEQDEQTEPAFFHYPADAIPHGMIDGVSVRVMIGQAFGLTSPVKTYSPTLYAEASMRRGQQLQLPAVTECAVYVVSGQLQVADTQVNERTMVVFGSLTDSLVLAATTDVRLVIIGGDPVGERFIEWNFVATDKQLIESAKERWRHGKFAKVPGDETDFIPYD